MIDNFNKRIISIILISPLIIVAIFLGGLVMNFLLFIIFIIGVYEVFNLKKILSKIIILILLILFVYSIHTIRKITNGDLHLYLIILITWLSDIGGYIFGKFIGGKKIKIISPNKTYSGFVGSMLMSLLSLFFINKYNFFFNENLQMNFLLVIFLSILVILGDLLFSYFKRENNIKDYSNLIPGHGGIFDRIDGMILLTIFYKFLLL